MSKYKHLIGKPYSPGVDDCYSLCRSYYREVWGIQLPNYARPDEFWLDPELDLYQKWRDHGFELITDQRLQIGDAFLMPIMTRVNSHAAVLVASNTILHHLPNQLSREDSLRPKWWNRITVHLRHPEVTAQIKAQRPTEVNFDAISDHQLLRDPRVQATIESLRNGRT